MKRLLSIVSLLVAPALFAANTPVTTTLTAAIAPTDRTLAVSSITPFSPLMDVTIDGEEIHICSVNASLKTVRVCVLGRGRGGTAAASHSIGAVVVVNPTVKKNADGSISTVASMPGAVSGNGVAAVWNQFTCNVTANPGFWTCNGVKGAALTAGTSQAVAIVTMPARAVVHAVFLKHSVAFAGTSISDVKVQAGVTGTAGAFMKSTSDTFDVFQSVATPTFYLAGTTAIVDTASTSLLLTVTTTGANVSALTAGSVEVTLWVSILP